MVVSSRPRSDFWQHRTLLSIVAVLLLLMMQQEGLRHALRHLGDLSTQARQQSVLVPVAVVVCDECALLAGGAAVLTASSGASIPPVVYHQHSDALKLSRPVSPPSYYSSRAPPVLL